MAIFQRYTKAVPENRKASPVDRALADVLVAAYKGRRLTQADLVERTGITTATMQRLLAGRTSIEVAQLFAITDAIGGKTAAEYVTEAEQRVAEMLSETADNVTPINGSKV